MKKLLILVIGLFPLSSCIAQFTKEQKEFCVNTFKSYLNPDEKLIQEREELYLLTLKHSSTETTEDDKRFFRKNIIHIDSVMHTAMELVKQDEIIKLADLLEKERYNIYAHPHNNTYLCWDFHSVLALIYSKIIEDDREYFMKLADFGEFSRMMIEAVQANSGKPHPLYLQVLNELKQIYTALGNQSKKQEIEQLIANMQQNPGNRK